MDSATNQPEVNNQTIDLESSLKDILEVLDQEREYQIITRRFGLYGNNETLEQIGELLGVTRERVRQLEKAILNKLKTAIDEGKLPVINHLEKAIVRQLAEAGRISRVDALTDALLGGKSTYQDRLRVAFIATISPNLTVIDPTDKYHHSVGIKDYGDEKKIRAQVEEIVSTIKQHKQPITIEELHEKLSYEHPSHVEALANVSKSLATLDGFWGLSKWPTVNPRNIRDKIYITLKQNKAPMHFADIAKAISGNSDFKRKDVTVQAIHNELIKDPRFVLIGRGIYALSTWGFDQGTVADIIAKVLQDAAKPMHRDEIVQEVLKSRRVKEATVLLNLQSRPQFKRVAKATYVFEDNAADKTC